jgi:glycosyltransferase involved in cell wall biosynthesis
MKIVWFSHSADLAGAELCLLEGARGLAAGGHQVHVVLPMPGRLGDRLQRQGISVSVIAYRWWIAAGAQRRPVYRARRLARNLVAWPRIRALLSRIRPDLAVTNTLDIPAGALAARSLGIPHLWYIHELFGAEGHGLYFDYGVRPSLFLMDRLANRVLTCSHVVQAQLCRWIAPGKLQVVYQAVEVPGENGVTRSRDGAFRLVMVGRIASGKRPIDAVRALSLLVQSGHDVRLALIGSEDPEYGASLRSLVRDLQVADHIEFIPFTENPFSHVMNADVALNCSRGEAFGRVTVEAMKLGKPVIGADSAGTRELIRDGWNGLLFRMGDPEDLAGKIEALYRDRDHLRVLGCQAHAWARDRFNTDRYTRALQQAFEEVIAGRPRNGST